MRLHRFYTNTPISKKEFDITNVDLISQWKNVFRYNVGSQVIIFDGHGIDYLCIISSLRNLGATLAVIKETKNILSKRKNVWLCSAIIKKDNFELLVQKATEIGVNHIVPVLCDKSEKKNLNLERLNKITVESAEQSGRGDIPSISSPISLQKLLDGDFLPNRAIYLSKDGGDLAPLLKEEELKDIAVFIGPEGGFSAEEIKDFSERNIPAISLGSQTLRAETAAISISSLFLLG